MTAEQQGQTEKWMDAEAKSKRSTKGGPPYIISASRRTDIPAFYAKWFINRIRAGFCTVPNPLNKAQVSRVSLRPEDVLVFVFWTRYPKPLMEYLDELDKREYRYYFQFTLMDNPPELDPKMPPLERRLETFKRLADKIGREKVIWRYDPIVISEKTSPEFHLATYSKIIKELKDYTRRSVISIVDLHYRKIKDRIQLLQKNGTPIVEWQDEFGTFVKQIAGIAQENGLEIQSCAEAIDLKKYGILPGKCIDDELIKRVFGIEVPHQKDPAQREACHCVISRDIGMYDSCLFGCVYCYATSCFKKARENHLKHNPDSPSLLGWYEPQSSVNQQLELELELEGG
jgi:hypothetical protein